MDFNHTSSGMVNTRDANSNAHSNSLEKMDFRDFY